MAPILCQPQDVTDRITSYGEASEARMLRFIDTAQDIIVGETRRDWVASSDAIIASTKELLKSCTASHAAKNEINANDTNFPTLNYKVNALNVNQDEFLRTLRALKDLDTVKIRKVT